MSVMTVTLLMLASSLAVCSALYSAQNPVTVMWDQRNGKGNNYNVDTNTYPFGRSAVGSQPEQITITYQSPSSVVINWVTGNAQIYNDANKTSYVAPNPSNVTSIVQYAARGATAELNASSSPSYYTQDYYVPGYPDYNYNYTSGLISHVVLANLTPNTEYYYRVGDGNTWSLAHEFTTLQAVGTNFSTYRIGVVADLGITANSSTTFTHLTESMPDLVTMIGDFCYADNLVTNGSISSNVNYTGSVSLTYQPTWDSFFRWWSTLMWGVPYIAVNGNHEYEQDAYGNTFNSYNARYNQTSDLSGSGNSRYYSVDLPGLHYISLSPYDDYNQTSKQYQWLQKDLAKFDRRKTQWLVVQFHTPMYNTYVSHYKEVECARLAWEDLFNQYGVDLIMHGHTHAYERTNRVYNFNLNDCAPMWITVGDGGNIEQLAVPMVDVAGACPLPSLAASPGSKFQGNCQRYSLQSALANATNNGYCPTAQPSWSAYREPSFGHGTLDVSPQNLTWRWHRNQDAFPVVTDSYVILPKDSTQCSNALGASAALAPLPYGSPLYAPGLPSMAPTAVTAASTGRKFA